MGIRYRDLTSPDRQRDYRYIVLRPRRHVGLVKALVVGGVAVLLLTAGVLAGRLWQARAVGALPTVAGLSAAAPAVAAPAPAPPADPAPAAPAVQAPAPAAAALPARAAPELELRPAALRPRRVALSGQAPRPRRLHAGSARPPGAAALPGRHAAQATPAAGPAAAAAEQRPEKRPAPPRDTDVSDAELQRILDGSG